MTTIWIGVLAGLGLAVPVGAMSIMLFQTSATRGWRHGATAGLAMATVDLAYAILTAIIGGSVIGFLADWGTALSVVGAGLLLSLGLLTVARAWHDRNAAPSVDDSTSGNGLTSGSLVRTFLTFTGATIINPQTALYFLAIAPSVAVAGGSWAGFGLGVFLGSVAWQQVLAFGGSLMHKRSNERLRFATGLVGGGLVVALSIFMLIKALV